MEGDIVTRQNLSRRFTGSTHELGKMFHFLEMEFPEVGSNYLLVNLHQLCKIKRQLKIRSQIFPRLGPLGTMELMPLFFF
jgi:hypothetical protein